MENHVIYIPGLGDKRPYGQNFLIQFWRIYGLIPHYLPLYWAENETFDIKMEKILRKIKILQNSNSSVSLVGVSAGASAAINAYAENDGLLKVICISGKINNARSIGNKIFDINPGFKESLDRVGPSLEVLKENNLIKNIMSIHPAKDRTVPVGDTIIAGALEKTLPGKSHITGILFGITVGGPLISNFIHEKL